jgi:hypothetical protein
VGRSGGLQLLHSLAAQMFNRELGANGRPLISNVKSASSYGVLPRRPSCSRAKSAVSAWLRASGSGSGDSHRHLDVGVLVQGPDVRSGWPSWAVTWMDNGRL